MDDDDDDDEDEEEEEDDDGDDDANNCLCVNFYVLLLYVPQLSISMYHKTSADWQSNHVIIMIIMIMMMIMIHLSSSAI